MLLYSEVSQPNREILFPRAGRKALTLNLIPQVFTNDEWYMRLRHVTLWPAVQLRYLHLTSHPPSIESELWVICPKVGRDVPEPFTVLANTSEVIDGDSNTTCRMSTQLTLSSAYCFKWMELRSGYPPISLSSIMTPGPSSSAIPDKGEPGLQAKQGWRPMLKNKLFHPQLFFFSSTEILLGWVGKWEPEKRAGKFWFLLQLLSNRSEFILSLPELCLHFLGNSPRTGSLQWTWCSAIYF